MLTYLEGLAMDDILCTPVKNNDEKCHNCRIFAI